MKTKAIRIYGKNDLRLEEFELPALGDDEILAHVISDSICMSSYKAAIQGPDHKRVPNDVADNPTIIGHEFCGEIVEVGRRWQDKYKVGDKFTIQPAICVPGRELDAPGYSYKYCGGDATYIIIPVEFMERGCFLQYDSDVYYYGSLAEPMSCIIGAFHANYHTTPGSYVHSMGIVEGGKMALLAGVGPMGLGAIDYAIHCDRRPALLVVTDIDQARLDRAQSIYTVEEAAKQGVRLIYLNTGSADPVEELMRISGGTGYNDVFVFAPVKPVVEQGDRILSKDGCLNFFAGPTNTAFSAEFNFYNVHYAANHIVGTSGGNTDDLKEAITMMAENKINPSAMITHVGGMNATIETTLNLPKIPGGKKLMYNNIQMELTAIADFGKAGESDERFKELDRLCKKHNGLWNPEAEKYLLSNF